MDSPTTSLQNKVLLSQKERWWDRLLFRSVWALAGVSLISLVLSRELGWLTVLFTLLLFPLLFYLDARKRLINHVRSNPDLGRDADDAQAHRTSNVVKMGRGMRYPRVENLLVFMIFLFSLFRLLSLKANFLIVVAEFLIAFLMVKLGFAKERKDLMQIMILSFFLLLSAATLAIDFSFLFCFLAFVITLSWALSLYVLTDSNSHRRFQETQNDDVDLSCRGDPLPARQKCGGWSPARREGTVPLPYKGTKTTLFQQDQNEYFIFQYLLRNTFITLGLTVLFSVFIFLLFPRLSFAVFQGAFLGPARQSGFAETIRLGDAGKIRTDPTVVMRVKILSQKGDLISAPLYLRGQTLSHFDGIKWTAGDKKSDWLVADRFRSRILKAQKVVKNRFQILSPEKQRVLKANFSLKLTPSSYLTQKIYLESLEGGMLFGVPWVEQISAKAPQISLAEDFTIQMPANFSGRMVYEVRSILERPSEKILLSALEKGDSPQNSGQSPFSSYLELPPIETDRIRSLLAKIVSSKDSSFIQATKIEKFFKEQFQYSLEPVMTSTHPIAKFLFETRSGHCEYFASAMALLLRLAGIPSRVVTGFLAQEWNQDGNYFVVRNKDAHAWVEAYLGSGGEGLWIEFDPSPGLDRLDLAKDGFWAGLKQKIDYLNFLWHAYVLSYDMESQKSLAKEMQLKSVHFSRKLDGSFAKAWRWFQKQLPSKSMGYEMGGEIQEAWWRHLMPLRHPAFLMGMVLTGLFALFIYRKNLKYYFNKSRAIRKEPYDFYSKMLQLLKSKGFSKYHYETPYEFAKRCAQSFPNSLSNQISVQINYLTQLFCKIRYSFYKPTESELSKANHSLDYLKNLS